MKQQLQQPDCSTIVEFLSRLQHLHPHAPLGDALAQLVAAMDCCPHAAEQGVRWLQLDPHLSIGRLRRSQLVQLAQSTDRFWRRSLAEQAKSDTNGMNPCGPGMRTRDPS